jgi:hypothetical protein
MIVQQTPNRGSPTAYLLIELSAADADDGRLPSDVSIAAEQTGEKT